MTAEPEQVSGPLMPGDFAHRFHAPTLNGNAQFNFDSAAGQVTLMLFLGSGAWPACTAALELLARHRGLFDDEDAMFFGVSCDPADVAQGRIAKQMPGIRWFLDYDRAVSCLYGAATAGSDEYRPHWLLLDRSQRVVARAPLNQGEAIIARAAALAHDPAEPCFAPVLMVPRVFEPGLCRALIDRYETLGGEASGFMRDIGGKTVGITDGRHKRRSDHTIEDEALKGQLMLRLRRFLIPSIRRTFQFEATRIERWIIGCYDDRDGGGHFRAHRDNTTRGTAHRKFACTINLDAEAYDGGDLSFPEFGPRTYRAPTGGAVIFSCSLLHAVAPVTRGRRYAFLPFFYDEDGARIREANAAHLADGSTYRAGVAA
jgi:predicted 2-oxoglutarate/Fe(II)-dependent dioxygenase YbiX/peroxiredoxin